MGIRGRFIAMVVPVVAFLVGGVATAPALASNTPSPHILPPAGHGHHSTTGNLFFHGGVGGIGVETTPTVFLVFWGFNTDGSNDPSGEASYLQNFLNGVGGSSWLNIVTQYCQGIASGTSNCTGGQSISNPSGILAGTWTDNVDPLPRRIGQSNIAAEAVAAATHFGNTTATSNESVQYMIATPFDQNQRGFPNSFCAYHTYAPSTVDGNVAFDYLPYIPQAGALCGAGAVNNPGTLDGVSIVAGHEVAEAITDQFPAGGWLDQNGLEIGDKCEFISSGAGAPFDITLSGEPYAVQTLWSNAANAGAGGCATSF